MFKLDLEKAEEPEMKLPTSTGMAEFNSDDHYIYYCRQESLRRTGIAIIVNKRVQNSVVTISKMTK